MEKPLQESLLVVSERSGQMHVRDINSPEPDAIEEKIHLINCLTYLAKAKGLGGLVKHGPNDEILDHFGQPATNDIIGADRKADKLRVAAKEEYKRAVGYYALLDSRGADIREVNAQGRKQFSDFLKEYYLGPDSKKSLKYREQLEKEIDQAQQKQTVYNREHGLRPHQKSEEKEKQPKQTSPKKPLTREELKDDLYNTSRGRLWILRDDIRAGFPPASNNEKNKSTAILDYLDNPLYPLEVNEQLFEIMGSVQKYRAATPENPQPFRGNSKDAVRAIESFVWEMTDFYIDAVTSLKEFEELYEQLAGCASDVLVTEEILPTEEQPVPPVLARVIRDMDIYNFMLTGETNNPKNDVLAGTVIRDDSGDKNEPGHRNKTSHDLYTTPDRATKAPKLEAYLKKRLETLKIGEVMEALQYARPNQFKRGRFHEKNLRTVLNLASKHRSLKPVAEAARMGLEGPGLQQAA